MAAMVSSQGRGKVLLVNPNSWVSLSLSQMPCLECRAQRLEKLFIREIYGALYFGAVMYELVVTTEEY